MSSDRDTQYRTPTWRRLGLRISKDACVERDVRENGTVKETVFTALRVAESIVCVMSPTLTNGSRFKAKRATNSELDV
jgi:hypothetical protein